MKSISIALSSEILKLFRSKILLITIIAFSIIPFVGGFFMIILKDPEFARNSGLIGAKAQLAGSADWPSYFGLLSQAISIGGLLLFGFITSWTFGREYSDRTLKDLLALPISRISIVISKFVLIFLWSACLSLLVFILGLIVGNFVVLPHWSMEVFLKGFNMFFICSFLTIILSTPVAFFACIGRGYLSPLGFVIFTLAISQIVAAIGYGQFLPWAVPALYSNAAGDLNAKLGPISYILVLFTSIIGLISTALWWRFADN